MHTLYINKHKVELYARFNTKAKTWTGVLHYQHNNMEWTTYTNGPVLSKEKAMDNTFNSFFADLIKKGEVKPLNLYGEKYGEQTTAQKLDKAIEAAYNLGFSNDLETTNKRAGKSVVNFLMYAYHLGYIDAITGDDAPGVDAEPWEEKLKRIKKAANI